LGSHPCRALPSRGRDRQAARVGICQLTRNSLRNWGGQTAARPRPRGPSVYGRRIGKNRLHNFGGFVDYRVYAIRPRSGPGSPSRGVGVPPESRRTEAGSQKISALAKSSNTFCQRRLIACLRCRARRCGPQEGARPILSPGCAYYSYVANLRRGVSGRLRPMGGNRASRPFGEGAVRAIGEPDGGHAEGGTFPSDATCVPSIRVGQRWLEKTRSSICAMS